MASKVSIALKEEEARQAEAEWRKSIVAELARLTAFVAELKADVSQQAAASAETPPPAEETAQEVEAEAETFAPPTQVAPKRGK